MNRSKSHIDDSLVHEFVQALGSDFEAVRIVRYEDKFMPGWEITVGLHTVEVLYDEGTYLMTTFSINGRDFCFGSEHLVNPKEFNEWQKATVALIESLMRRAELEMETWYRRGKVVGGGILIRHDHKSYFFVDTMNNLGWLVKKHTQMVKT